MPACPCKTCPGTAHRRMRCQFARGDSGRFTSGACSPSNRHLRERWKRARAKDRAYQKKHGTPARPKARKAAPGFLFDVF